MAVPDHRTADGHHPTARHPSPTTSAARRRMGTDFLNSTAVALAEALLSLSSHRGVGLHFIQVGANAGDFLQENVHLNQSSDPVRIAVQRLLRHERTRGLLIEPNPPVFKQLDAAVHREFAASGNAARRVSAQNIAVCAHRTGTVDFYTVDPRIMEDFPQAPYYVRKGELATMSRESITLGLRQIKWARRQGSTRAPEEFILTQQVRAARRGTFFRPPPLRHRLWTRSWWTPRDPSGRRAGCELSAAGHHRTHSSRSSSLTPWVSNLCDSSKCRALSSTPSL